MARENFYSARLSGPRRKLYDSCIDNIKRGRLSGHVDGVGFSRGGGYGVMSNNDVNDVIKAVLYGNPELFYLDQRVEIEYGMGVGLNFTAKYDGISDKRRELDEEVSRIASKIRICGSTYDRLCRISAYLGERIRGSESPEQRFGDAYGALILKEARCEGYAKAAKLIMDKAGIQSEVVIGTALDRGVKINHAWNIAYMGNKPYWFDFTWNDKGDTGDFPGVEYLFLSDADMKKEHFSEYEFPACTDDSQTFWARNNGYVRSRADIAGLRLGHMGKNLLAAVKFDSAETAKALQNEVIDAIVRLAQKSSKNFRSLQYFFNDRLNVLSVYPVI